MISLSQLKNNRVKNTRLRLDRSGRSNKLLGLPNLQIGKFGMGFQIVLFVVVTLVALFLISSVSKNSNIQTEAGNKAGSTKILTNFNNLRNFNQSDSFEVREITASSIATSSNINSSTQNSLATSTQNNLEPETNNK